MFAKLGACLCELVHRSIFVWVRMLTVIEIFCRSQIYCFGSADTPIMFRPSKSCLAAQYRLTYDPSQANVIVVEAKGLTDLQPGMFELWTTRAVTDQEGVCLLSHSLYDSDLDELDDSTDGLTGLTRSKMTANVNRKLGLSDSSPSLSYSMDVAGSPVRRRQQSWLPHRLADPTYKLSSLDMKMCIDFVTANHQQTGRCFPSIELVYPPPLHTAQDGLMRRELVRGWAAGKRLFFFAVNIRDYHWVFVGVNFMTNKMVFCDSLPASTDPPDAYFQLVSSYLAERFEKYNVLEEGDPFPQFKLTTRRTWQQKGGTVCGVYVIFVSVSSKQLFSYGF